MLDPEQIDLNSVCRVCLLNALDMKFLDDVYSKSQLIVADVYKTVTNIEFTDMMPKHICHDCFCELSQSYKYILKCQNSNSKIQTSLEQISKLIIDTQIESVQTAQENITFRKDYVQTVVNNLIIGNTTPNETKVVHSPTIKSLKYPLTISELLEELEQDLYVTETNAITIYPKPIAIIDPIDSNPKPICDDTIPTTETVKPNQKPSATSNAGVKSINGVTTKSKVASKTLKVTQISQSKAIFGKRTKQMKCHDDITKKQKSSKLNRVIATPMRAMNKHTDLTDICDANLIIVNDNSINAASTSKIPGKNSQLRKRRLKTVSISLNENQASKTNSSLSKNNLDAQSKNVNEVLTRTRKAIKKEPETPKGDNRRLTRQMKTTMKSETKPYACANCDASFYKEVNLHRHLIIHALDKPHACSICGNKYKNKSGLTKHERTHSGIKPYKCQLCPKAFIQKVHMRQHMCTHTKKQPYTCSHCGTKFTRKTNLLRHAVKHTGVRLFACIVCKKAFIKKQFLMTHLLSHNGGKLFSCKNCEKSFSHQIHLMYHERTHTGELPHACTVCGKSFNQIANLNRHMRIHTELKTYTCAVCDWSFKEKANLAKHVSIHVGEKLHTCKLCNSPFNSSVNLKRHLSTHDKNTYIR